MEDKKFVFETTDLYYAAFLISKGCKTTSIESHGDSSVFHIVDPESRGSKLSTVF